MSSLRTQTFPYIVAEETSERYKAWVRSDARHVLHCWVGEGHVPRTWEQLLKSECFSDNSWKQNKYHSATIERNWLLPATQIRLLVDLLGLEIAGDFMAKQCLISVLWEPEQRTQPKACQTPNTGKYEIINLGYFQLLILW